MTTSHRGPRRYRGLVFICSFLIAAILPCSAAVAAGDPGSVRLARGAESNFDAYTASPSPDQQSWMRNTYWRMRTYAPYFNARGPLEFSARLPPSAQCLAELGSGG